MCYNYDKHFQILEEGEVDVADLSGEIAKELVTGNGHDGRLLYL